MHELKTPLAAIQINAHLLLSRSVARATHMVHQLLGFELARAEPIAEPLPHIELGGFVRSRYSPENGRIVVGLRAEGDGCLLVSVFLPPTL